MQLNDKVKKVLIVDDDVDLLEQHKVLLESKGVEVVTAETAEEGIMKFESHQDKINIVLLDIELPKIKGTEVVKRIKKLQGNIPVVAQTAYAMQEEEAEIMKTGFDAFIAKPFKTENLISILSKLLQKDN